MLRWLLTFGFVMAAAVPRSASAGEAGVAFFAMPSPTFPCDRALEVFEEGSPLALAILWSTFGEDAVCLKKWFELRKNEPHFLEIHPTNETCRRSTDCEDCEITPHLAVREYNVRLAARDPKILEPLTKRIQAIAEIVKPYVSGGNEIVLSTGLEDNFSAEAYAVVLETVRAAWPYKVVRNPVLKLRSANHLTADYLELHGDTPVFPDGVACIANLDGVDMQFDHRRAILADRVSPDAVVQYLKRYKERCRVAFLWSAPWQGIHTQRFVRPSQRKFIVDDRDLSEVSKLLKGVLSPPP